MAFGESWGRTFQASHKLMPRDWAHIPLPKTHDGRPMLAYGLGKSYGDSCLNDGGILMPTQGMGRVLKFDQRTGLLRCEAGITLEAILRLTVPAGWFLPVVPGTKFITLGGAIANDIHGKNHHAAGTFGCHMHALELLRSDGSRNLCTPQKNTDLLHATIGGLGLTGLITWAEIQLKKISSAFIDMESIKVRDLDEFLTLSASSDKNFEYTVSWLDSLARGRSSGKGVFLRGNHCPDTSKGLEHHHPPKLPWPIDAPNILLNRLTIQAFNLLYYNKQIGRRKQATVHYDPFFFPLDAVHNWNRVYGKRGFFQYQFVLPFADGHEPVREILKIIADSGQGSFLAVIKTFGSVMSPGLLSFPRPGVTVALDFPNSGKRTRQLFHKMDEVVLTNGGRLYPAKDACMSAEAFGQFFPEVETLLPYIDPAFSSSFWRRVRPMAT
jgi:FAD/FMN-containing dehydrogenase